MISILLATYNSEQFINEQIDSLLKQTYTDWNLFIRDDLSVDKTPQIIKSYSEQYPKKIHIISNNRESKKAYLNFIELLKSVDSDYYMFCDHDDIWLPNKIELSMNRMKEVEKPNTPVIVHTDMKVVDEQLNLIHPSFWKYSNLQPERTSFVEMVLCNSANGCTMLFNQKAKELALPNVAFATMHDILLNQSVAAKGGIISPIYEPTVLYRQHIDNVVGAHKRDTCFYLRKLMHAKKLIMNNIYTWQMASKIKPIPLWLYVWTKFGIFYFKVVKNTI